MEVELRMLAPGHWPSTCPACLEKAWMKVGAWGLMLWNVSRIVSIMKAMLDCCSLSTGFEQSTWGSYADRHGGLLLYPPVFNHARKAMSFSFFSASWQCQFQLQPKSGNAERGEWAQPLKKKKKSNIVSATHGLAWTWKWMFNSNLFIRVFSTGFASCLVEGGLYLYPFRAPSQPTE